MIDFACKRFDIKEIVKCSLGLTKSEFRLLEFLMKNDEGFSTEELAESLGLDLTTVQRAVKRFFEKRLVMRKQKNLENGGYIFVYSIMDRKEIRKIILNLVQSWTRKVEEELDNL